MPIEATNPSVVAATFDKWAITSFTLNGDGLVGYGDTTPGVVTTQAVLIKYRVREDGVGERSPVPGDIVRVDVPDLYALAGSDPVVGAALQAMTEAIAAIATRQGLL